MTHRLVEDNDDEAEQVLPTLTAWQNRKPSSRWSNTAASQPAFDRADLNWCRDQARSDPTVEEFSGRAVLSQLSASAEGRLRKVAVGRQNDGTLDVEVRWVLSWFDLPSYSSGLTRVRAQRPDQRDWRKCFHGHRDQAATEDDVLPLLNGSGCRSILQARGRRRDHQDRPNPSCSIRAGRARSRTQKHKSCIQVHVDPQEESPARQDWIIKEGHVTSRTGHWHIDRRAANKSSCLRG